MRVWLRWFRWFPICLASFALVFPAPLCADIIPSRPAHPADGPTPAVAERLDGAAAGSLSASDLAYLAERPERVQVVGALPPEVWVGAIALLVVVPIAVFVGARGSSLFGD